MSSVCARWAIAWIGCFWLLAAPAAEIQRHEPPESAPPLVLDDIGATVWDLGDLRGRVVLINFWASWCPPCLVEMPALQSLQKRFSAAGFRVFAVNAGESDERIWQTARRLSLRLPMLRDPSREATRAWGVDVFPTSFLIDAEGRLAVTVQGMLDWRGPTAARLVEPLLPNADARVARP